MKYVKADEVVLGEREGAVVPWNNGVVFRCPCGERQVYIASPPHTITFDEEGLLHVDPSLGYKARPDLDRPTNWCHFNINNGIPSMHSDSKCPGSLKYANELI